MPNIVTTISRYGTRTLASVFIEETRLPETGEITYVSHEQDSTFVHGKVHRRQYLLDSHIRWNDALTIHEDSYFNILCQNLSPNVKYCQTPFYLWRWRDESVCRHDPKYILKTYRNMIDSNDALVGELLNFCSISQSCRLETCCHHFLAQLVDVSKDGVSALG